MSKEWNIRIYIIDQDVHASQARLGGADERAIEAEALPGAMGLFCQCREAEQQNNQLNLGGGELVKC